MEVEMQLAQADFGEDYTPIDRSYLLKSEFMLNSKLDLQTKVFNFFFLGFRTVKIVFR